MIILKKNLVKTVYEEMKTINQVKEKKFDFENNPQRDKIKICVIDDEGFTKKSQLAKLGYSDITELYSFESVNSLKEYDVILCDMDGIGKLLDETKQGIAVAEQLRINFPLKKIFIYSGKTIEGYGELPNEVEYISKQLSANELSKYLDNKCSYFWDPIESWEYMYELMIKSKLSAKTIAVIEDRFVTSILEKKNLFYSDNNKILPNIQTVINVLSMCAKIVSIVLEAMKNAK